jgi:hypothetical protein
MHLEQLDSIDSMHGNLHGWLVFSGVRLLLASVMMKERKGVLGTVAMFALELQAKLPSRK